MSPQKNNINSRGDTIFRLIAASCAIVLVLVMVGIMIQLIRYSGLSLHRFGLGFLVSNVWNPVTGNFGAASSILGTLASTAIAMILALPISIFIAMFLAELAPPFISKPVGYAIESAGCNPQHHLRHVGSVRFCSLHGGPRAAVLGRVLSVSFPYSKGRRWESECLVRELYLPS